MKHSEIAAGLGVSRGRISQLAAAGMPTDTVESASAWRKTQLVPRRGDGAEDVSLQRALLLAVQRKEVELRIAAKMKTVCPISVIAVVLAAVTAELGQHLDAMPGQLRLSHPELGADALDALRTTIARLRNAAADKLTAAAEHAAAEADFGDFNEERTDDEDDDHAA